MRPFATAPIVLAIVLLAAPAFAQLAPKPNPWKQPCPPGRSPTLWSILDEHVEELVREFPVSAGPNLGDDRYNDRLDDVSAEAVERRLFAAEDRLARLRALDRSTFTEADRLDYDLLTYDLTLAIDGARFHPEQLPVAAQSGPQYWLPQLADFAPFTSQQHYVGYAHRLLAIPDHIDDHIANMRAGIAANRVPPRVVVEPAIAQARALAAPIDPTQSPLYKPFIKRTDLNPSDILAKRAREIIADDITPAYERLADFLENEYLPACRDSTAIAHSIDGPAAYDFALRTHTTLNLTADDIHAVGLREVARIRAEMLETIARTDWPGNDKQWPDDDARFAAFIDHLRTDPRFYYTDPDTMLADYRNITKLVDAELPRLFTRLPRLPYGVRPIPRFAAESSPSAYYYPGSLAGGIAGTFMVNTSHLDHRPIYEMTALALHEAVPGHHLQIALAQELDNVHAYRRTTGYTAYVEGWALYAESLGLEFSDPGRVREHAPPSSPALAGEVSDESASLTEGVRVRAADAQSPTTSRPHTSDLQPSNPPSPHPRLSPSLLYADPYQNFGRLNFEMWRAMRLVVDTGIHARSWTRDQAITYMTLNSAISPHNIRAEVDRYIAWPGQACGYMLGRLAILDLRRQAEQTLGPRFDLRAFHDHLLGAGALPLPVLEARMKRWTDDQRQR